MATVNLGRVRGADGRGLQPGGTLGQALVKTGAEDFATGWKMLTEIRLLWSGSWASGNILLSEQVSGFRFLMLNNGYGCMLCKVTGTLYGETINLWGNEGQWHRVQNLYYVAAAGNTLTFSYGQKLLNGNYVSGAVPVLEVYGVV